MFSRPHAQPDVVLGAGNRARARAVEDHPHLVDALARHFQRIQQRRAGDDRRAVLVVVEDRNLHRPPQLFLDDESTPAL